MSSLTSDVVILCWDVPAESNRNAQKIAEFLGADATFVTLTAATLGDGASLGNLLPRCKCLIVDVETLAKAGDAMPTGNRGVLDLINKSAECIFIYGFQPTERHGAMLRVLSSGDLVALEELPASGAKFHVADNCREWAGQFSGLSLGAVNPTLEKSFRANTEAQPLHTIIKAGDKPFYIRTEYRGSHLFLLACGEVADLDENVLRQASPLVWLSRLVPLMVFLRGALGSRVWHNDKPRACFIIDDPLLKSRYGFLEYQRLAESMRQQNFSMSIAFIPWNYRRSSQRVAKLFSTNKGQAFLCVHGCDHTGGEFATTDADSLRGKAKLALERMQTHHRLSGVPFDDVMVFPQGLFSVEAMAALKFSRYLAAVNSDVFPSTMQETLALRDLLEVAITRFADFPLFSRRYPRDLGEFAFDLFMGKPALAAEHHGYFRDGYEALETFVSRLNALDDRVEWTNLATICSGACLTRTTADGEVQVRFYTSRFRLENTGTETRHYVLLRKQTGPGALPAVTIDGREWSCETDGEYLKIHLSLDTGQTADIRLLFEGADSRDAPWRGTEIHNARVWLRRRLCEFRDNYVDTRRVFGARAFSDRSAERAGRPQTAPLPSAVRSSHAGEREQTA